MVLTILYFIGFIYLIFNVKIATDNLLKHIHFNLALVLRNENDMLLMKNGIRARPGYLSKWIEYHRYSLKYSDQIDGIQGGRRQDTIEDDESLFARAPSNY